MNLKTRMYASYAVVIVLTGIIGLFSLYSLAKVDAHKYHLYADTVLL